MNATWKRSAAWVLGAVLLAAGVTGMIVSGSVRGNNAQPVDKLGGPRYSVVHTEGSNLLVTDNFNNQLYFYTIEEDGKPGDELLLRGTLDLTQVGKKSIKPTLINPKKKRD